MTFVREAASVAGIREKLGLSMQTVAVSNTRNIGKQDTQLNDAVPAIEVNPEPYEERADGELLICEPAERLPMVKRYFLF